MTPKGYGPKASVPPEMSIQPRDYQLQGLYWLTGPTPPGKILADDMGLGKTLQALATVASLPNRPNGARQVLIIVPRQVLRNWVDETAKVFNPGNHPHSMAIAIVHGVEGLKPLEVTVEDLRGYDIVLTTPETICAQIRTWKKAYAAVARGGSAEVPRNGFALVRVPPSHGLTKASYTKQLEPISSWQMIIVDEGHLLRSRKGAIVKNLIELKAERKLVLTGTLISNTPEDIFNILLFLEDEASKDLETFRNNVVQPIVTRPHLGQVGGFEKDFGPLHDIFRRVLLRRDKSMTINGVPLMSLKKKIIIKHLAKFSELEEQIYEATYQMAKAEYKHLTSTANPIPAGKFVNILENFLRLRQACCDVGLLLDASRAKELQQTMVKDGEEDDENPQEKSDAQYAISMEVKSLCESAENRSTLPAKSRVLMEILDRTYEEDPEAKVLIFTEWTRHLQRLLTQLTSRGYNFLPFHGGLSAEQRDDAQRRYSQDRVNGLVLTVGCGGQGLNLVQANVVILLTPPWNPQRDAQAMDRTYRLGQTKDVQVHHIFALSMELRSGYNWKTLPTIEDLIQRKQSIKLDFIAGSYGQEHTEHSQGGTSTDPEIEDAQRMYGSSRYSLLYDPTELQMEALLAMQASHQDPSSSTPSVAPISNYKPYVSDDWLIYD